MKNVAIIAEFNPFHNGHKRIFESARENGADNIIVIMSGDYVQRGLPAVLDKFTRTYQALECGADLVLELPVYYSLGSADYFASGAVSVINHLGCIDTLLFGSETGNIDMIRNVAQVLNSEPSEYLNELKKASKKGLSFPMARQSALQACMPSLTDDNTLIVSPNNILAIEYTKALLRTGSQVKPSTLSRNDKGYSSTFLPEDNFFASATAIRKAILSSDSPNMDLELIHSFVPQAVYNSIESYCREGDYSFASPKKLSSFLRYKLNLEKMEGFTKYLDVHGDLSDKIINHLNEFDDLEQFALLLKSKDITYTRLCRSLLHILLNITSENMEEYKQNGYTTYLRVLGLKKSSSSLIKTIKSNSDLPLIQQLSKAGNMLDKRELKLLEETITASSIYDLAYCHKPKNEYTKELVYV
ncbi:MAG: nucleotidyltransferase family protein [Butyrivibrio sp.]|nr:nucleotidyltransferase family protein [Butyrivibrio sp.]